MSGQFSGSEVNEVLRLAMAMSDDGDHQLNILGMAFVIACRSIGIEREVALTQLAKFFDRDIPLIPLNPPQH